MALRNLPGSLFGKAVSILSILALLAPTVADAVVSTSETFSGPILTLRNLFTVDPPEYVANPVPTYEGDNPSRDEITRFGVWTQSARECFYELEQAQIANMDVPISTEPTVAAENYPLYDPGYIVKKQESRIQSKKSKIEISSDEEDFFASLLPDTEPPGEGTIQSGTPYPWELAFPGGGSVGVDTNINSNTGNRQTIVPLFSMPLRGGFTLEMNLYHNSRTVFVGQFGRDWSCDFDARLQVTEPTGTLVVRWGDGTPVPFTWNQGTQKYEPSKGFYDTIVKSNIGGEPRWVVTTKNGVEYTFRTPNGGTNTSDDYQGILEKIKWPGSDSNVITVDRLWNGSARIIKILGPDGRNVSFAHSTPYGAGSVSSIKDSYADNGSVNRIWSFQYDAGKLWKVKYPYLTSPSQIEERVFTYDGSYNILTETDLNGGLFSCSYTGDNCTGYVIPMSYGITIDAIHTIDYQSAYSQHNAPYSKSIKHHYNLGAIQKTTDEAGFEDQYTVNPIERSLGQYKDRRGFIWKTVYDIRGNVTQTETPNGEKENTVYNTDNTVESTYGDLTPSTVRYEYTNRVLRRAYRDLSTDLELLFNNIDAGNGWINSSTTYDGVAPRVFSFARDGYGAIRYTTDPNNQLTETPHTTMGWVKWVVDQLGHKVDIEYDRWGRPANLIFHNGDDIHIGYDNEGNVTSITDERDKVHTWTYNPRGQAITYINAKNEMEIYTYSLTGFLLSVKNGRNYYRYYEPTIRDEVKKLTMPDGTKEFWQYDQNGNVGSYRGAYESVDQWTTSYTYDESGRPTYIDYPTGVDTSFQYTNFGHTIAMVDSTGTTTWTYDSWGDLTSLATPQGTMTYVYNRLGERTSMTESGVGTTTYQYDTFGRLKELTNYLNETTKWTYDYAGRLEKRELPNGTWEDFQYDSRNRLEHTYLKKTGATLRWQDYTYDAASNVLTHTVNGVSPTTYGYDNINQLTSESRSGYSCSYDYDENGNRKQRIINGVIETYTNDAGDKLTSVSATSGMNISYTYDSAGRRKTKVVNNGSATNYSWDYESRITQITKTGLSTHTYQYNGLDTRVKKTDAFGVKTFKRDGAYVTDPVLSEVNPFLDPDTTRFTPGISSLRDGTSRFLHSGIKNVDAQTLPDKTIESTRKYDAFGNVAETTGFWDGFFGYAGGFGYQEDDDYGLKLLGHRYYDPEVGRFLSRDPIKHGNNWFTYCWNNPLKYIDASGLEWHDPTSIVVDKDFDGKVWVVGEPGPGKEQVFVQVMPGQRSPVNFDVDIVIVQQADGSQKRYFVPGANPPEDPAQIACEYTVSSTGKVKPGPPVYREIVKGRFPGMPYDVSYGVDFPVLAPYEFGPGIGGSYLSGNWNDDIHNAKKRRYRR